MLAFLALQNNQVLVQDAATMSIARYGTSGPSGIFIPLLRGTVSREVTRPLGLLATVLMLVLASVSQLTSTILLWDMGTLGVPGNAKNISVNIQQLNVVTDYGPGVLGRRPIEFPRFAEEKTGRPPGFLATGHGNISDTGERRRALFPLAGAERLSMISYTGPVTILDSHVMCFAPGVEEFSMVSLQWDQATLNTEASLDIPPSPPPVMIMGSLNTLPINSYMNSSKTQYPYATFTGVHTIFDILFNCTSPVPALDELSKGFPIMLCQIPGINSTVRNVNDEYFLTGGFDWWLVVRGAASEKSQSDWLNIPTFNETPKVTFDNSEWTTVFAKDKDFKIQLSVCVGGSNITAANVTAVDPERGNCTKEPELSVKRNDTWVSPYNTEAIRNQLGVLKTNSSTAKSRGIITIESLEYDYQMGALVVDSPPVRVDLGDSNSIPLCLDCGLWYSPVLHSITSTGIFRETLNNTGSIALALQALWAVITTTDYYDRLTLFDIASQAQVQERGYFSVPKRMTGLYIVGSILFVHLALVASIVAVFIRKSEDSTNLGQAWQTVAQLCVGDREGLLGGLSQASDVAVGEKMDRRGWRYRVTNVSPTEDHTSTYVRVASAHDKLTSGSSLGSPRGPLWLAEFMTNGRLPHLRGGPRGKEYAQINSNLDSSQAAQVGSAATKNFAVVDSNDA